MPVQVSKISNRCCPGLVHQRHRQMDGWTTCNLNTALYTKVHRAVKIVSNTDDQTFAIYAYIVFGKKEFTVVLHNFNFQGWKET